MENALYIVATPIGNMGDITARAIEVLKNVDYIFCEDTRVTNKLLEGLEVGKKSLFVYNDFSSDGERIKIINFLKGGKSIALVSDAGTPLISDPGFKLVRDCKMQNLRVIPIVGASAVMAALSSCGLPTDKFLFYGFLSEKENERKKELENLRDKGETIVLFESPKRIMYTLNEILNILGDIDICVSRELTKTYEDIRTNKISNIIGYYEENSDKIKGEFVVVLSNRATKNQGFDLAKIRIIYNSLAKLMTLKEIADFIVKIGFEYNKKELYNILVGLQSEVKNGK